MRSPFVVVLAVGAAVVLGGCTPQDVPRSFSSPLASTASGPAVASPVADDSDTSGGTSTTVTRVIDGDTFVISGGDEVRVLGIDSCEAGTPGGTRATAAAEDELLGRTVRLTAEPGVDRDRYGRELRYVATDDGDFAATMVRADHTAIYTKGRNDASAAVQASLRALDADGRTCGAPETTTARPTTTVRAPAVGTPAPRPAVAAPAASSGSASYANCTAVRAAGAAPLYRGQPGYSGKLDRDGDGVACE